MGFYLFNRSRYLILLIIFTQFEKFALKYKVSHNFLYACWCHRWSLAVKVRIMRDLMPHFVVCWLACRPSSTELSCVTGSQLVTWPTEFNPLLHRPPLGPTPPASRGLFATVSVYVLVTSASPLAAFLHTTGLVRPSLSAYSQEAQVISLVRLTAGEALRWAQEPGASQWLVESSRTWSDGILFMYSVCTMMIHCCIIIDFHFQWGWCMVQWVWTLCLCSEGC